MSVKSRVLRMRNALAGVLLALLIASIVVVPEQTLAGELPATPSHSLRFDPLQAGATQSDKPFSLNVKLPSLFTASPEVNSPGSGLNEFQSAGLGQGSIVRPLFDPRPLFDQTDNGRPESEKRGVRKRYLALGILGLVGVAGGAVAVTQSNKYCTTNNIAGNGQAQSICSSVHTAGEVMIPVGAAVAVLGFYFAFRHRQ
jgi:hypothetical protein